MSKFKSLFIWIELGNISSQGEIGQNGHGEVAPLRRIPGVKKIIAMIPLKLLVVFRALRMKKKWNYHEITEEQLNSKISDIRNEYNINVYKLRNKLN